MFPLWNVQLSSSKKDSGSLSFTWTISSYVMYIILSPSSVCLQLFTWSVHFPNSTADNTYNNHCVVIYSLSTTQNCAHADLPTCRIIQWVSFRVNSLYGMKCLTSALQECGHELVKCSWILEECSHLVEVVWRHQNILWVPHDIDHLWQIFMKRKSCLSHVIKIKQTVVKYLQAY